MIISFGGVELELTPEGAVWIPRARLLVVADLHLEKGSYFLRASTFLPPYDSNETLQKLGKVVARFKPAIFIAAGDSFHDRQAAVRLRAEDREYLNHLIGSVNQWLWLSGNHDPNVPMDVKGEYRDEFVGETIVFRHRTAMNDELEISGHFHPKIRLSIRQQRLTVPCFVRTGPRLILPSFGRFTGGLDIESEAFKEVSVINDRHFYAVHDDRVFWV